jgi:hypothetical protein
MIAFTKNPSIIQDPIDAYVPHSFISETMQNLVSGSDGSDSTKMENSDAQKEKNQVIRGLEEYGVIIVLVVAFLIYNWQN